MSRFESWATLFGVLLAGTKGRTPDLRSDDEGGSFAAGRARKSLSLPGRFRNSSMKKPAETVTLPDISGSPINGPVLPGGPTVNSVWLLS